MYIIIANLNFTLLRYVDGILAAFDTEQDSLNFLDFWNNRHPNNKFAIEKQINHSIAFINVFISGAQIDLHRTSLKF